MANPTTEEREAPTPEDVRGRLDWLDTRMDGVRLQTWIVIGTLIAAVVIGFGAWWIYGLGRGTGTEGRPVAMHASRVVVNMPFLAWPGDAR